MARNPYQIALWTTGGLALVLALMLSAITWEMSDYATYDVAGVASIESWVRLLVGIAAVTFTGAVVIAGVAHQRRSAVGTAGPSTRAESRVER